MLEKIIVILIVAAASGVFVLLAWRRLSGKKKGCGCCGEACKKEQTLETDSPGSSLRTERHLSDESNEKQN